MKRKYLDDIGVDLCLWSELEDDKRQARWAQEREEYGFDERDTWCMNYAFYCWLYERLKMYLDVNCVDLTFHKFEYEGEELTQQECIDRMLHGCEVYFQQDNDWTISEEDQKAISDVANIWAIVLPAMWW